MLRVVLILLLCVSSVYGQGKLIKDLDHDNVKDTVYINMIKYTIVCKLSSQNFKKEESKPIDEMDLEHYGIKATKNGFEFVVNWMRAGYRNQFRYDLKSKKIQLIGMSRYDFGSGSSGGGKSSINLLTSDYVGDWTYYNVKNDALIPMPTIRAKMPLGKVYLDSFSENTYIGYAEKCAKLQSERVKMGV